MYIYGAVWPDVHVMLFEGFYFVVGVTDYYGDRSETFILYRYLYKKSNI